MEPLQDVNGTINIVRSNMEIKPQHGGTSMYSAQIKIENVLFRNRDQVKLYRGEGGKSTTMLDVEGT